MRVRLADMSGNVWEWTQQSAISRIRTTPSDDRANLDADALWVMRGGGFGDDPQLDPHDDARRRRTRRAPRRSSDFESLILNPKSASPSRFR